MDSSLHQSEPERAPGEVPSSAGLTPREAERASLKSLRDHVSRAVEEIVRLRAQNKSLARRLAEFEAARGMQATVLEEGADVQELKTKIASFISSIDAYLAESNEG